MSGDSRKPNALLHGKFSKIRLPTYTVKHNKLQMDYGFFFFADGLKI